MDGCAKVVIQVINYGKCHTCPDGWNVRNIWGQPTWVTCEKWGKPSCWLTKGGWVGLMKQCFFGLFNSTD